MHQVIMSAKMPSCGTWVSERRGWQDAKEHTKELTKGQSPDLVDTW